MQLSVVVNTCALGPRAMEVTGSHTRTPHAVRAYALRHFIIPHYLRYADEVVVVGEYEEGDYTYIHAPSVHFSAVDALHQRQAGFEATTGEWVAFVHDDHWLDLTDWCWVEAEASVLVPTRWKRGEGQIINGMEEGYIGGHCAIYRRDVIDVCPWGEVEKVWVWDTKHTAMIRANNFGIYETDMLRAWDVEA